MIGPLGDQRNPETEKRESLTGEIETTRFFDDPPGRYGRIRKRWPLVRESSVALVARLLGRKA